ncbi:LuxR family transcriptional regulator [Pseudonocardia sp. MH-G8]|uniref:helix-turn-helix transcriptional regulator n=1 Tax=Pseudonocardia sp. MH-G8 TaxID=1854588 RepID=UPI000B9FCA19|nr:LuxR family transcriptional regulator [Pseudonocardia sp. MH-G8]OZM80477.1 LuxR family transcriptional regulator [Pseudonocardia sp. MH-G8]
MTGVARLGVGIELVGRRHEVSALSAALDRAASGTPTGVLVAGDAGVGKSRLVAEATARAAAAGFTVLVGRCLDTAESALPYLPFTEIVGTLAATHPTLVTEHVALRHLLPGGFARAGTTGEWRDLGQLQVFDAVLSVLHELGAAAPVLLVLEDLHWADRSSRDLLVFLLSRLRGQRLVVLATYRSDDLHRRHPLRPVLSELVRLPAVERIQLDPLDRHEALELVRRLADGSLAEPVLHNVARRSEGNAFFAEELVSAAGDGLPHGLVEVLVARIEGLAPATQRVLRIASVAGRRVSHPRLAAVSGLPVDELEQALREAVAHHVLVAAEHDPRAAGADDAYAFRHALLREAIYHELLPGERSRLHAAYAALLAVPGGTGPRGVAEPGLAAELAHHAMAGHDLALALAASVQASSEAADREAPAEVLLHAERALELWSAVPDAAAVAGVGEGMLTRWAAWGASSTGDPDRGIALGRRALELVDERQDPGLSSAIGRRYALRLLDLAGHEQEALAAARHAVGLIAHEPASAEQAWAHAVLARVLSKFDHFAEAVAEAEATLRVARQVPADPDGDAHAARADALVTLAVCAEYGGDPERARELLAEAKPLARRSGDLSVELRAFYAVGISLLDEGRLAEAAAEFAAGGERADATGTTWSAYGLELRVAHVLSRYMHGEWDTAEAAAEIAGGSVSATVAFRLAAAGLLTTVGRGRFAAARRRLAELRESAPVDEQVIMLVGQSGAEAALWQGRPDEAARCVRDAVAGLNTGAYSDLAPHLGRIMLGALGAAAHADMAAAGSQPHDEAVAAAREMVRIAEEAAERGLPRAGRLGPEGRAWLTRARAELTRLAGPADPGVWREVAAAFTYETDAHGDGDALVGYRQAHAMWRGAEAALAAGAAHALVGPDLHRARATALALGAAPLAGALEQLGQRAGVVWEDTARPEPVGPDPLTPRERSVLAIVAQGHTNRQVGAELFISEKTVSVHLSRVMAKLGASSRTEAVSLAYARGLLAPTDRELARSDP